MMDGEKLQKGFLTMKKFVAGSMVFAAFLILSAVLSAGMAEASKDPGCYLGIFKEGAPQNMNPVKEAEKRMGRKFTVVMWYSDWSLPFQRDLCEKLDKDGYIPHIVWEPWLWSDKKAIKLDNINAGEWDGYIRTWAQDLKRYGKPVFIRWGHEFNIEGYPWGIVNNSKNPAKYVKAYRHVHDIFTSLGVTNARWIWCPMRESWPMESWNDMHLCYPGDKYVDWIGIDGYNWGTTQSWSMWQTFKLLFRDVARDLWRRYPGKPLMIAEFAAAEEGGDKGEWISQIVEELKNMPYIKNINWFDQRKETDWRIDSSKRSVSEFSKMMKDPYFASSSSGLSELALLPVDNQRKTVQLQYAYEPIAIDGVLNEWTSSKPLVIDQAAQVQEGASIWRGPSDLSGKIYFKWDVRNLYIAADITDNFPITNSKSGPDIWNGDSIEMVIGLDKNANPGRNKFGKKDFQIGLGAGDDDLVRPSIWNWTSKKSPKGSEIDVKRNRSPKGYTLEAKIPWASLTSFSPYPGIAIGFDCAIDDSDSENREKQMVWNGDYSFYKDPGVWGRMEFLK